MISCCSLAEIKKQWDPDSGTEIAKQESDESSLMGGNKVGQGDH